MVSIIVLSYNTCDLLQVCLKSIFKTLNGFSFEVIVADNASKDGSVKMIKEKFKEVILIENKDNFGFGHGNNIAAKKAKGDILFFLNSDTKIIDNKISRIEKFFLQDKNLGIVGGLLQNPDGSIQKSLGKFYNLREVFLMLFFGDYHEVKNYSLNFHGEVDWITGAAMFIRKDLFERVGGFDEHYFMYIEDMDLCYRIRELGFKIIFEPNLKVIHLGQGSSNRSFAIINIYKGILYFYKKHKSYFEYCMVKFLLIAKAIAVIIFGFVTSNDNLVNTYKKAIQF